MDTQGSAGIVVGRPNDAPSCIPVIQTPTLVELEREQIALIVGIEAANIQDIYPLTPLQEGVLFDCLLNKARDTYIFSTLFEFVSRAHAEVWIDALNRVIERHEVMRSSIVWEQVPRPIQVIHRHVTLRAMEIELDGDRDPLEQLKERMRPGRQELLDLRRAPLATILIGSHPSGEVWYGLLQVHHLISDLQSLKLIVDEAIALVEGREGSIPAPEDYRNYVVRNLQNVQTDQAKAVGFFASKLADVDEPTAPFGIIDAQASGSSLQEASRRVDSHLTHRIRERAQRLKVSAARIFHAAWGLVVARTSGRDDVVYGTVLSVTHHGQAVQGILGLTVNSLPLRLRLRSMTAEALVDHTNRELLSLLNHAISPLVIAQRCSSVQGGVPLFTTLLNYRRSKHETEWNSTAGGVRVLARGEAPTNYAITVSVDDHGEEFLLTAQTDSRLDPSRILSYLEAAARSLVEALEQAPQSPALSLSILPPNERHELLEVFSATPTEYPQEKLIHELFEEQVERTPQAIALVYEGQTLTYAELNQKGNQLGRHLRAQGAGADQLVALCVERSIEMVVGLLGVLKAGGAYVPLDPTYPSERLAYMLEDAAPRVLLTQERLKKRLPATAAQVIALDQDWGEIAQQASDNLGGKTLSVRPDHLAYVIYTSGSTGKPKGVLIEHRNVTRLFAATHSFFNFNERDVWMLFHSFAFDFSVWELWGGLLYGGKVVVVPTLMARSPQEFYRLLCEEAVTVLNQTPSAFAQLINAQANSGGRHSLRVVIFGGEALELRTLEPWVERNGTTQPQLVNMYGITETTVHVTYRALSEQAIRSERGSLIGRPIPDLRAYVLDKRLQLVPVGVAGELYVAGAGVARGYLNRPELTGERFIQDPFSAKPQGRMYKTGDLARWRADGTLEYLGRNDHQVKIRGFRIELGEIEAQLARHARVKEAVVLAREDVPGEKRLVAYLVPRDEVPSIESLRSHLAALPEHMVPSAFVTLECLPLTSNGKLDRGALPAPELGAYASREYEAPQGEVEEILAGIWQGLLRVQRVGREDNFFELGGHSLLIVQLLERLRRVGLSTEVRRVFESPRLADLASTLSTEATGQIEVPPNLIPVQCEAITPQMLPLIELEREHIERIVQAIPGGAANIQDIYPLTPLQEGLLFHHLLNERSGDTYVLPVVLSVSSRKRLEELVAALQSAIDRHEILRTAVLWEQLPRPAQVVYRRARLPVEEIALEQQPDPLEQAKAWIKPERQWLDLRRAPLMRLQVAQHPNEGHWYAFLQMHHITIDHATLEIIVSEIARHLEGRPQQLPESLPYRNHVAQVLVHAREHDVESFFRKKLGDLDEPTAPFGLLDVYGDGSQIAEAQEVFERALAQRVRTQARRVGVSAATLFHAAWAVVVGCTSGRDDVAFGSVLLGRMQGSAGAQLILGTFINTLPLRLRLQGATVKELVEQAQRELVELLSYEQASLAVAQRCSGICGSAPLFTALLNYRHSAPTADGGWGSASGIRVLAGLERTNYPVTVSVDDLGEDFLVTAQTDRRIDPSRIVGYLHTAVQSLVEALESSPQSAALSLSILPSSERHQLLEVFNATRTEYPQERLIHELFEEQVERTPQAIALVYEGQTLTYAELNQKGNQLGRHLRAQGVGADQLVALCVERSIEMVVGLLGVLKAGGAYVPLDPTYPSERLAYMLEDAAPRVLLTQERLKKRLPVTAAQVIALDQDWSQVSGHDANNLPFRSQDLSSKCLAYMIYTSGSTGRPKGVMVEHRPVLNLAKGLGRLYGPSSVGRRIALNASLNFDASVQQLVQLTSGATLVVVPEDVRLDAVRMPHWLEEQRIDSIDCTPSQLSVWIASGLLQRGGCLRTVLVGGEAIDSELWTRLAQCVDTQFYNVYGPTECVVDTTIAHINRDTSEPHIGHPMQNRRVYILSRSAGPVPVGAVGEIHIGGAGIARGYLNQPELTAERFVSDPYSSDPQARMYKTGDLGRWRADGTIEYLGRNDHQVKIRGLRIELGEIEAQLARHAQVKQAVVLVREDVPGEKRLVAYLVPRDEVPHIESLRSHLAALPEHMVPSAFVTLECLPLTPNGKLDRNALLTQNSTCAERADYLPPATIAQQILADIWRELLKVDRLDIRDDFFALGGHSLLAVQMIARVNKAFGIRLPTHTAFQHKTIATLAARLGSETAVERHPLRRIDASAGVDATLAQLSLWSAAVLDEFQATFNMCMAASLEGPLDTQALQRSIDSLSARHDVLQTTFDTEEGVLRMRVRPNLRVTLRQRVLEGTRSDDIQAQLQSAVLEERNQRFDLAQGPPARALLVRLTPTRHLFVFTVHHIVADVWSINILLKDLGLYYSSEVGLPVQRPPELAFRYVDFASWQNELYEMEEYKRQTAYWQAELANVNIQGKFPIESGAGGTSGDWKFGTLMLPDEDSSELLAFARRKGITPYVVLMTAMHLALVGYSGLSQMVVWAPLARRQRAELEDAVGFYVNLMMVASKLCPGVTLEGFLTHINQKVLEGHANCDVSVATVLLRGNTALPPIPAIRLNVFDLPNNTGWKFAGITATSIRIEATDRFDSHALQTVVRFSQNSFSTAFSYSPLVFNEVGVGRLAALFRDSIHALVRSPSMSVDEFLGRRSGVYALPNQLRKAEEFSP